MAEVVPRGDGIEPDADAVHRRDDRRHLRDEVDAGWQPRLDRRFVAALVERDDRGDGRAQDVHRVRGLHAIDDLDDGVGDRPRRLELAVEPRELCARRQGAVEEQVARFLERRVLRQVVDVVAAIDELSGFAVDEADARLVEYDALESGAGAAHVLRSSLQCCLWRGGVTPCFDILVFK